MKHPKYVFVLCDANSYKPLSQWQTDGWIRQYAVAAWDAYLTAEWQELPHELLGEAGKCHANCLAMVKHNGGEVISGWRQLPAAVQNGVEAEIAYHSVWRRPDGCMLDITPVWQTYSYNLFSPATSYFHESPACAFADTKPSFGLAAPAHLWRVSLDEGKSVKYLGIETNWSKQLLQDFFKWCIKNTKGNEIMDAIVALHESRLKEVAA